MSPQEAPAPPPCLPRPRSRPAPATPTSSTHFSSAGWDWWLQASGRRRCPGRGPHPQESRRSRALWGEQMGSAGPRDRGPAVSTGSELLLTAADGLCPTPDPVLLALALRRPCQHQIRGAAVSDLVPKAEARPSPHCTHRNARVGAVTGCEEQRKAEVSRDSGPGWPTLSQALPPLETLRASAGPLASPLETSYLCFPGVQMEKPELGKRFRTLWPQWPPKTSQSQPRVSASTIPEPQGRWQLKLPLHREHLQTMRHHYTSTSTVKTKKMGNSRCQRTTRAADLSRNYLQTLLKDNGCQPVTQ